MAEIVEPKFLVHQATHLFLTDPIFFQITQMSKSVFVWIGKPDGKMGDMSVAVPAFATQVSVEISIQRNNYNSNKIDQCLCDNYHGYECI